MTEWLLALVPQYGIWLLAISTFLSCLALPVPASILMLAAGGFVAAGDLSLTGCFLSSLIGAIAGDQLGYLLGRKGGASIIQRLGKRAAPISKASEYLSKKGGMAVFLSRWLVSALGPYVNFAAGASGLNWARFTIWEVLGEVLWVGLYIGLGRSFMGNLSAASGMALNILGLLAVGVVAIGLGLWLKSAIAKNQHEIITT